MSIPINTARMALLGAALVAAAACGPVAPSPQGHAVHGTDLSSPPPVSGWPSDAAWRQMVRGWHRGGRISVVVDSSSAGELEAYRRAIDQVSDGSPTGPGAPSAPARVIPAEAVRPADLQGPLLLVGPAGSGAAATLERTPLAVKLPLRLGEAVRVMTVNPWNQDAAMMVISGSDDAAIRDFLGRLGAGFAGGVGMRGDDYDIHRDGMRVSYGRFARGVDGRGSLDPAGSVDLRSLAMVDRAGGVDAVYVRGELSESQVGRARDAARKQLSDFVSRLGGAPENAALRLVLYADRETKAVRTGDPRWSHCEAATGTPPRVHMVAAAPAGAGFDDRLALGRAAQASVFGQLAPAVLADGTALWLAGELLGRPLGWWRERLDSSGLRMTNEQLLDAAAYSRRSYLMGMPSAALMVGEMLEGLAPSQVRSLLADPARFRRAALSVRSHAARPPGKPGHDARAGARRGLASFQKGMSLSHEGYAVIDGYGSEAAAAQMRHLAEIGVDWIGLSPYGFMRDPAEPEISFLQDEKQSAGTENDVAVLSSIQSAHGMGLKVMLKPQIWLPRGHWTGDVAMTTLDTWRRFFSRYREFLAHYALLAEAGGADLLVIGVELQQTSARQAEWREMIAVARALYAGPLTYAANWGREFEQVAFWDALDYAGLDCYYPLAGAEAGSEVDERLLLEGARDVARRVGQVARRSGKSVILTEVGFPALAQAWRAPHDENTGLASETEAQARCYRAVLAAFWEEPWLAGVFWWKWPTTRHGARGEPLFSPRGNPAERVVAEWYARTRPRAPNWPIYPTDWSRPSDVKP